MHSLTAGYALLSGSLPKTPKATSLSQHDVDHVCGFRIYLVMEREKYGARSEITLCTIPFPRCTTSGRPECCQDGRLAMLRPYRGDGCGRVPRRCNW